jgi:nucleotide-binding universal stress UspA family protein
MTPRPVTVGTDGTKPSLRAVDWAAREAAAHGLPLRIVSVPELPSRMCSHHVRALGTAAERAAALEPGLTVGTELLLPGLPADALVESAASAAMLVVGSRGAGTLSEMILGSVSRHVATHACCPVVVVREETTPACREVVVGVGAVDQSGRALEFAFEEAALRHAVLVAMHAWSWYLPATGRLTTMTLAERAELNLCYLSPDTSAQLGDTLERWRDKYPDVQAEVKITRGHPGRALAAASSHADLVVLGRWPADRAGPGGNSVTHAVLHDAHAPVAVIAPGLTAA